MIKATVNGGKEYHIEKQAKGFTLHGKAVDWDVLKIDSRRFHILRNQKSYTVDVISADRETKSFVLKVNNKVCTIQLRDRFDDLLHELGMDINQSGKVDDIKAPMPGLVVDVRVEKGQLIKKGDPVVVLEAMKMENILKAAADATVKSISVKKGSKVEKNEVLVILQ